MGKLLVQCQQVCYTYRDTNTPMIEWFKARYLGLRASFVKKYRTREVIKTLQLAHAAELAGAPLEQWPTIRAAQASKIQAVRDGNYDIIDRRSWVFPYLPETLHRLKQPIIKNTPYNIRRFARTPVPRRAINLIKSAITSLDWDIVPIKGTLTDATDDQRARIERAKHCFTHPNDTESFFQFQEEGIDDLCVNGAFCIEPQLTPDPERPWKMWTVDSTTIRIFADWKESTPDQPHYAQMTGLKGERGIIVFYDDELVYIKDNPQVDSPFGLGKMEVGFSAINSFLGVQDMAGRAGADQIHKTWLWWPQAQAPNNIDIIRRHIMNDLEGQAKVSLVAGMQEPKVIEIIPVSSEDLLMDWQEFLLRIIACAFDLSAMALNLERDINRSTGEVLDDKDFRSAVVPVAKKLEDHFTRFLLHRLMGWDDLKFSYLNMDDPDAATKMLINQQLYTCNAITPNDILKSMGLPPSAAPYSDLTQFEAILVQTMAQAHIAQTQQDTQFQRQQQMMEQYGQPQQQPGQPGAGGNKPGNNGGGSKQLASGGRSQRQPASARPNTGGTGTTGKGPTAVGVHPLMKMPKLPKMPVLKLKQLPIAGSIYSADEIAVMSVAQVQQEQKKGTIPANNKQVGQQMQQQNPNVLQQLSEELKEYFELLEDEHKKDIQDDVPNVTPQEQADQEQRYKEFQHDPPEIERVINKGTEKSPPLSKLRITRTTSHPFNGPNTDKAFSKKKKKQRVSRSGGAATGVGVEQDHNPPTPNGWPGRRKRNANNKTRNKRNGK